MTSTTLFSAHKITKSFEGRALFDEIDLAIRFGEKIAITGRSGSGKTTLLNILGLLETTDSGSLFYKDGPITTDLAFLRNQKIGFIFQFHYLNGELTVFENLELPRLIQRQILSEEEALSLLKTVQLKSKIHTKAKYLSGGEKQRIAFIRALINNPDIILADEPTGQLDSEQAQCLMELLLNLPQAVVLVTHDKEFASRLSQRYELINQRLIPW